MGSRVKEEKVETKRKEARRKGVPNNSGDEELIHRIRAFPKRIASLPPTNQLLAQSVSEFTISPTERDPAMCSPRM